MLACIQGDLALLLAVDPAAPDGDRLIGYQLVHGHLSASTVEGFLMRLKAAGIARDEVITDGSARYPAVLAKVWPVAAHQWCLFHEPRRVTAAVLEVSKAVRQQVPSPPPMPGVGRGGPQHPQPPSADPHDPAPQRWHWRRATRRAGPAEMQGLAAQGLSQRAIARQTGHHRQTVRRWLQEAPEFILVAAPSDAQAATPPAATADQQILKQSARREKLAQIHALGAQGQSYSAIARQVGLHRVTVKQGFHEALPAEAASSAILPEARTAPAPPPAPGTTWEEVKQIRETLKEHRFLLLRQPEHLSAVEQTVVTTRLEQPGWADLRVARDFLIDWYRLWTDENRQRRSGAEAQACFETWRADTTYAAIPVLKRSQERLTPARFQSLSQFLQHPDWEATNNGAERAGRAFRHRQAPHFNLRTDAAIERSIIVTACLRKQALTESNRQRLHTCPRGRRRRQAQDTGLLLTINQPQELAVA